MNEVKPIILLFARSRQDEFRYRSADPALNIAQPLMAELTTAVANKLPVKIVVLKNNSLAEVMFEQQEIGNPSFGCDLAPIDFVAFARACGADGFRCETPGQIEPALRAAFSASGPALVEAVVDAQEKPTKPDALRA